MRINRTNAQFRDRDRLGATGKGNVQEQACAYLWQELVGARRNINPIITLEALIIFFFPFLLPLFHIWSKANWKRRAEIIDYCVHVVDGAQVRQSDHRSGDCGPQHPPLSVGVSDEVKVRHRY